MTTAPLKSRILKATAWLIGGNVSSQLLRLISNLLLTRLLTPDAFGLVACVNTLYFGLVMFSDFGVWQSVVKSEDGTNPRFLGTAWSIQLLRGLLLCLVVLGLSVGLHVAAGMGVFEANTAYADPRLPLMMAVFSLSALLQGAESMQLASAQRELHVGHLARLEIFTQLSAMVVTLVLAWATHSVWSLLIGTVFSSLVRTLLSHFYLPGSSGRPCWDTAFANEIFGFGKWIFMSSVIGFLAANGEKLILGATLVTASFGVFSIAATLLAAAIGVYSSINGHVIFSSLSLASRSDDRDKIKHIYTRAQQVADLFLGGLAGIIFMSGHWAVWLLYDKRYQDAGWMLQWLALGLIALRQQVVEQLMFARGKPSWVSANNSLRALSLVVLIPLGFLLAGERGAIVGVVISQFGSWPFSMRFKYEQGLLNWATEKWWIPAFVAGLGVGWLVDVAFDAWTQYLATRL